MGLPDSAKFKATLSVVSGAFLVWSCHPIGTNACRIDDQFASRLAASCVTGSRNCYPISGLASAATGDRSNKTVREQCARVLRLSSTQDFDRGKDYIFNCDLGDVVGVFRVFMSNYSSSQDGDCYLVRYAYVDPAHLAANDQIIPVVTHLE